MLTTNNIPGEILFNLQNIFAHYPQVESVKLYGSRAKGTHREGSDIDISLIGSNIDVHVLYEILEELENLQCIYTFDVAIHHNITNQALLEHIQRVGMEIYKKASQ